MATMEKMRGIVMNSYDIRQLDGRCNFPHCKSAPEASYDIFEFTLQRNIDIVKLYLCKPHLDSTASLMKTLRKSFPDVIIQSKQGSVAQPGRAHEQTF
ncbi:MAG: hypothetical protein HY514_03730 [Candidatus Aenigmarchaeota archaeon]|nr:hypothetical protein [Candidatus Aenigmarchaeota archaeon]